MKPMKLVGNRTSTVLAVVLGIAGTHAAMADDGVVKAGELRFAENCVVCHGKDGAGGGPFANLLKSAPPDLTMLAQNNNGTFPFEKTLQSIYGRNLPRAHGGSDMPIWGGEWMSDTGAGKETGARGQVLEVLMYLRSIQK